jgi:hypothetical protein
MQKSGNEVSSKVSDEVSVTDGVSVAGYATTNAIGKTGQLGFRPARF